MFILQVAEDLTGELVSETVEKEGGEERTVEKRGRDETRSRRSRSRSRSKEATEEPGVKKAKLEGGAVKEEPANVFINPFHGEEVDDVASPEAIGETTVEVEEVLGEGSVEVIDIDDSEATAMKKVGFKTRLRVAALMVYGVLTLTIEYLLDS